MDAGDGREMRLKRRRLLEQGSSYYGTPSNFMYSSPPPAYSFVDQPPPFPVVRLRGLPFDCSEVDIVEFFHGLDVVDVLFIHKNGKFMGEVFCVLGYAFQVEFALQRNRHNIGRRYVEVFRSKRQEYYKAIAIELSDARGGSPRQSASRAKSSEDGREYIEHTGMLRLRGLPFTAGKDDIMDFFKDFQLPGGSIYFTVNSEGRPTGEAFVKFASVEDSKAAMVKDRMTLGNRYIELFPSALQEWEDAVSRGRPGDSYVPKSFDEERNEETTVLRMRGLPFSAGKEDILDFFNEFGLDDESIQLTFNYEGRKTGEAFVEFASIEDAKAALSKDRMTLGSRYIELFPSSIEEFKDAVSRGR